MTGVGGMTGGPMNWFLVLFFMAVLPFLAGLVTGTSLGRRLGEGKIYSLRTVVVFACFMLTLTASVWMLWRFAAGFVFLLLTSFGMGKTLAWTAASGISILAILVVFGFSVTRAFHRSHGDIPHEAEG